MRASVEFVFKFGNPFPKEYIKVMMTNYQHLEQLGFDDTYLDGAPEMLPEFEIDS